MSVKPSEQVRKSRERVQAVQQLTSESRTAVSAVGSVVVLVYENDNLELSQVFVDGVVYNVTPAQPVN